MSSEGKSTERRALDMTADQTDGGGAPLLYLNFAGGAQQGQQLGMVAPVDVPPGLYALTQVQAAPPVAEVTGGTAPGGGGPAPGGATGAAPLTGQVHPLHGGPRR